MIKVQVVRKVETETAWDFEPDPELRHIIEWLLDEKLESYIYNLLIKICQAIKKDIAEVDDFVVRILASDDPKAAWSFKRSKGDREVNPTLPDVIIGFANDPVEFEKNIIHETLHSLRYDEDMVEKKTQELYRLTSPCGEVSPK